MEKLGILSSYDNHRRCIGQTQTPNIHSSDDNQKCVFVIFNPVSGRATRAAQKDHFRRLGPPWLYVPVYRHQQERRGERAGEKSGGRRAWICWPFRRRRNRDGGHVRPGRHQNPHRGPACGTGNLLSINLGIPVTVPEAVHVALSGHKYQLDLARTSDGRYFAIMGGVGLDAQVIKDAGREAKKSWATGLLLGRPQEFAQAAGIVWRSTSRWERGPFGGA